MMVENDKKSAEHVKNGDGCPGGVPGGSLIEPPVSTEDTYRRLADVGVTPDQARSGVQQAHIDLWAERSETPIMAITQALNPELRAAIAGALGQSSAGDVECRSFCIGLLSRAVSNLIEGRSELPEPSDRERRGLRMIRTGNITSTSDADAADRWIDRVLGDVTDPPDAIECRTCLGGGRIRDGETRELRKCLDCNGTGEAQPPPSL